MTDEEKIEKLAKWAGWKRGPSQSGRLNWYRKNAFIVSCEKFDPFEHIEHILMVLDSRFGRSFERDPFLYHDQRDVIFARAISEALSKAIE